MVHRFATLEDDDGKAGVFDPAGADEDATREAMEMCPVTCIHRKK